MRDYIPFWLDPLRRLQKEPWQFNRSELEAVFAKLGVSVDVNSCHPIEATFRHSRDAQGVCPFWVERDGKYYLAFYNAEAFCTYWLTRFSKEFSKKETKEVVSTDQKKEARVEIASKTASYPVPSGKGKR
jgi:hypothetical protein